MVVVVALPRIRISLAHELEHADVLTDVLLMAAAMIGAVEQRLIAYQ